MKKIKDSKRILSIESSPRDNEEEIYNIKKYNDFNAFSISPEYFSIYNKEDFENPRWIGIHRDTESITVRIKKTIKTSYRTILTNISR